MKPQLALGRDDYSVLLLGEALGEQEAAVGLPFQGAAGLMLTRIIEWAGLERARFSIANAAWCQPPDNLLEGTDYEQPAVSHCQSHHWGHLLARHRVVVPLGNVALGALTGRKGILAARGYIQPGPMGTHLVPSLHPSFIRRGQAKYTPAAINDLQKAVTLARDGLQFDRVDYSLDPTPREAYEWAQGYAARLAADPTTRLAFDIETPGKGEDEAEAGSDDDRTYFIHRIGFSYEALGALSVPWTPDYIPAIRLLMESAGDKVVWNAPFDCPRIKSNGVGINGTVHDGMVAWHVLHSDLPKGLGFVATFTCPHQTAWKHLSTASPAFYNATDADVELRSMIAIEAELRRTGLWAVYERDVLRLDPILLHMSSAGMPVDADVRLGRATELAAMLDTTRTAMESAVPQAARTYSPKEGYAKTPADLTGLVPLTVQGPVRRCRRCGLVRPTKPHFRTLKRPTAQHPQNPCADAGVVEAIEPITRYAALAPWKPSRTALIRYHAVLKRPVPTTWNKQLKARKPSFDERAIKRLRSKYPDDQLYPAILRYRELDKLAGTYIGRPTVDHTVSGGMPVGKDSRVHTTFGHNPSSLRLCSFAPNMQNIPRFDPTAPWSRWVKELFVAAPGHTFIERDFSGIEAVLVGKFAGDPSYIRAAKLGIHAIFAAYKLGETLDLTNEAECRAKIKAIKRAEPNLYDTCKKTVHGSNYRMSPSRMAELFPDTFTSPRAAAADQEHYYGLFPAIPRWHRELCDRVDSARKRPGRDVDPTQPDPWTYGVAFAQNPYGYVHRFYHVLDWTKVEGQWISTYGEDAKRLISFLPQSTAAAIIKQAAAELWYEHLEVGRLMRLLVHDSIILEVPEREADTVLSLTASVMERPRLELPLDPAWGMGEYLAIGTEAKRGPCWAHMEDA